VILAAGAGTAWALTTVLTPARDVLESKTYTYVTVEAGEVGSVVQLNTIAEWAPVPVGVNRSAGIVTAVSVAPGDEVSAGSVLYTVALRPVVIAQGAVPAFRAIGLDTEGPDVAQLQGMLAAEQLYSGSIDGKAGPATVRAIKDWQKRIEVPQTGSVEVGDVIYVPSLPVRVALNSEIIFSGATLTGGEEAVQGLPESPSFIIPATESQAAMMPAGTRVNITSPNNVQWVGQVIGQSSRSETGNIDVKLGGKNGSAICEDTCGQVPVAGKTTLKSEIVTVEKVSGLIVPSAALVTTADGQVAAISEDGTRVPVTVVASARGMSAVEGIAEGARVRVPGEAP